MRNLYLRIFLSFWTAMVLVLTCTVGATLWLTGERIERLQNRQDTLAREASTVLSTQGVPALRDWLQQEIRAVQPHERLYVIDRHGVDLLGRPVPDYLQAQVGHRPYPAVSTGTLHDLRLLSQLVSPNDQTYALSLLHRPNMFGVFGSTETLIVTLVATLLASTVLCLLLARYLSDPVRHLRAATRSIADGDLRVRVSTLIGRRRDELALLAFDFDAMAERLRNLLESQRQLLRDVSHELRSPLARLQIALGLARRPNANLEQEFDRIEQETQRLDELIGEILSLSRLEDPSRELVSEPVNVEELLESLVENARVEAEPRWVRVDLRSEPALIVPGDRELLFRALENVVRNAVNYSPHGGNVELSAQRVEQPAAQRGEQQVAQRVEPQLRIRVVDHGTGVPPELLGRIFEPFFRVGKARERSSGGYGIGLAITARVVALHGGSVRAQNVAGGGLQVDITLPLRAAAAAAPVATGSAAAPAGALARPSPSPARA